MAKNDMTHKKLAAHKQPLGIEAHPEPLELPAHKSPLMVGAHAETVAAAGVAAPAAASMKWGVLATILGLALVVAGFLFFANHDRLSDKMPPLASAHWQKAVKGAGYDLDPAGGISGSMQVDGEAVGLYDMSGGKAAESAASDVASGKAVSDKAAAVGKDVSAANGAAIDKVVYLFAYDSSGVPESVTLNKVADRAAASGETVTVKAYTDATGNADYNRRLSDRRAKAVGDYLIAHGVPASHVNTMGMGPTKAFSDNAHDRRAEITFN